MARDSFEKVAILATYEHALGLGNDSNVSVYLDASIDATTEYLDKFGDDLGWAALTRATKSHN
jgi:hypothetical protein